MTRSKVVRYWMLIASSVTCTALWLLLLFRAPNEPGRDFAALGCLFGAYGSLESAIKMRGPT